MPVSTVALAGARLRLSPQDPHPLSDELRARILLLDESILDGRETAAVIREHIHGAT
jgi:hypothetical protein